MFNFHHATIILSLLLGLVVTKNCFDRRVMLAFIGISHSYVEKRVLAVPPESSCAHVQTGSIIEIGRLQISVPVPCRPTRRNHCFHLGSSHCQHSTRSSSSMRSNNFQLAVLNDFRITFVTNKGPPPEASPTSPNIPRHVGKCREMSGNVGKSQKMLGKVGNVGKCREIKIILKKILLCPFHIFSTITP